MNLTQYMEFTRTTAIYPEGFAVEYCALGLASEVGEVMGKLKKEIRDGVDLGEDIHKELGDVLWYWVRLADELGFNPEAILAENVDKLSSRKERGTIKGSGDER